LGQRPLAAGVRQFECIKQVLGNKEAFEVEANRRTIAASMAAAAGGSQNILLPQDFYPICRSGGQSGLA
jgi:hypothetical protein